MRAATAAILAGLVMMPVTGMGGSIGAAQAQNVSARPLSAATDLSAQRRRIRRPPTRLRVYREDGYLPPTAKRACQAWYEQEYRPSGTVIVPRMRCRWVVG